MNAPEQPLELTESSVQISVWQQFRLTPWSDLLHGRLSCRFDVDTLVAASDIPAPARLRILEIIRRTRLWKNEKVVVAGELIAHFADGVEAGASLDDLLESFGDMDTTAKLIRRAKIRCRPWSWHVTRYLRRALVCLIVFYIGAIFYYAMGSPNIAVNYVAQLNEERAVPQSDRAWPVYREALLKLDRERVESLGEAGKSPGTAEWQEAVAFVNENEATFATIRRAAAMPYLGKVLDTKILEEDRELWPVNPQEPFSFRDEWQELESMDTAAWAIKTPHYKPLRALARLLEMDTAEAARTGDGDRALANLTAILGMSRQLQRSAILVEQLVGSEISMQAVDVAGQVLREYRDVLSDAHLRELAHRFAGDEVVPIMSLAGERYVFNDVIQRMYTDGGRLTVDGLRMIRLIDDDGRGKDVPSLETAVVVTPFYNGILPSREELVARHETIIDRLETHNRKPYWETHGNAAPLSEWYDSLSPMDSRRHLLLRNMLGGHHRVQHFQQSAVGRRDALLVALALEMHRRRHGSYPDSLAELSPRLLPSVPRDRITGSPMRYRVNGDQAVVYSVGQDLDDDGGVIAEDAPIHFIEVPEGANQKRIEEIRKANEELRNETPLERRQRIFLATGPVGRGGKHAADGDWVLWHSAEWPVDRGRPVVTD